MTLTLYIARLYISIFLKVMLVIILLILLFDGIENLRRFSGRTDDLTEIFIYTIFKLPTVLNKVLPLAVLISSLVLFLGLSRSSELVVSRAAGISALRLLQVPIIVSLLLGAFVLLVLNPIVASTSKQVDQMKDDLLGQARDFASISEEGVWLRQADATQQIVIQALRADSEGTALYGVTFHVFTNDNNLTERIAADRAELRPGFWQLTDLTRWKIAPEGSQLVDLTISQESAEIPTYLTQDQILDSFAPPETISIYALSGFITKMEQSGFTATRHKQFLQSALAQPFLFVAMVLIGAGFSMRHIRFGQTGLMVLFAILSGFALFFFKDIADSLGAAGEVPNYIAAWTPPTAAILMSLGLLLHLEDG